MTRKAIVDNKKQLGLIRGGRLLIGLEATFKRLVQVMADPDPAASGAFRGAISRGLPLKEGSLRRNRRGASSWSTLKPETLMSLAAAKRINLTVRPRSTTSPGKEGNDPRSPFFGPPGRMNTGRKKATVVNLDLITKGLPI